MIKNYVSLPIKMKVTDVTDKNIISAYDIVAAFYHSKKRNLWDTETWKVKLWISGLHNGEMKKK